MNASRVMVFIILAATQGRRSAVRGFSRLMQENTQRKTSLGASFFEDLQKNLFSSDTKSKSKFYTVGITGSGGLVGTALRDELGKMNTIDGKPIRIVRLSRSDIAGEAEGFDSESTELELVWNPRGASPEAIIDANALTQIDSIVHLSGENVATGLSGPLKFLGIQAWSDEKKKEIIDSRVIPTKALAKAFQSVGKSSQSLLVASGVGAYGDQFIGPELEAVDETSDISSTQGFLADVSREWEKAANEPKGPVRVVNMRFGVVLSKLGGALGKLFPIFFVGGGGNVGSGQQYFSFISARDHARAIVHCMTTPSLSGPVNICAPTPCTNAEFTKAMGEKMGRPTILPFPELAVKLLFGEMGDEMLLGGVRALPNKLQKSGFEFQHPTVDAAVASALEENI